MKKEIERLFDLTAPGLFVIISFTNAMFCAFVVLAGISLMVARGFTMLAFMLIMTTIVVGSCELKLCFHINKHDAPFRSALLTVGSLVLKAVWLWIGMHMFIEWYTSSENIEWMGFFGAYVVITNSVQMLVIAIMYLKSRRIEIAQE